MLNYIIVFVFQFLFNIFKTLEIKFIQRYQHNAYKFKKFCFDCCCNDPYVFCKASKHILQHFFLWIRDTRCTGILQQY
jgi:hypothetical protein